MKLYICRDENIPGKYKVTNNKSIAIAEAPPEAEPGDTPYLIASQVGQSLVFSINVAQRNADLAAKETLKMVSLYKEQRKQAYPPIGDQLDAIYKRDHLNDPTDWNAIVAQISAVKAAFPKPE